MMTNEEVIAKMFHEAYEKLAPDFGYNTREASAVPWEDVPEKNKQLMIATVKEVFPIEMEDFNSVLGKVNILLLSHIDNLAYRIKILEKERREKQDMSKGAE